MIVAGPCISAAARFRTFAAPSRTFAFDPPRFLQHLGVYAYRKSVLFQLAQLPPTPLESLEKLEQLRALAHGIVIQVGVVAHSGRGVDTFDDYERFVRKFSELKKTWRNAA